jgi:hypothetical protein
VKKLLFGSTMALGLGLWIAGFLFVAALVIISVVIAHRVINSSRQNQKT